jgi:NAD(P)H-dependent flavin oxidoreductase YrpB (nitropropane dioxygenase family)
MGTRFVTTHECDASEGFKQAYIDAAEKDIEIIKSPVGMPGRAIFSSFIQKVREGKKQPKKCAYKCIKTCDIDKSPYCIIIALINAFRGNFESGFAFAGSNAVRATRISSVKEIFQSLLKEYKESKKAVTD